MRIIDLGLLIKDLKNTGLPVARMSTVDQVAEGNRSTYVPYFSGYLCIGWTKEPPKNYISSVSDIVSEHMGTPILSDALVEKLGPFPKVGPAYNETTEQEAIFNFTRKISDRIIPKIEEVIASGIRIRKLQISEIEVHEFLEGGDEILKSNLLGALKVEPALVDLNGNNIIYWSGSSGKPVSVNQISDWLLKAALKMGTLHALPLINSFLLQSKVSVTEVLCIDGFKLDESIDLLPNVRFITTEDLKKLNGYKRVFEADHGAMLPTRHPTAALVIEVTRPKFTYSDVWYKRPNNKYDFGAITQLLTLFGPSAPSIVANFTDSPPSLFSNSGGGWGSSYDEPAHHKTPFAPSINGFEDIYQRYDKLSGKAKDRVQISMGRLNRSLRRGDRTNKALELGIALESILLSGKNEDGSSGEISFRLASRGVWLLGVTPADRKRTFCVLKAAYRLRSKAAHEGTISEQVNVFKGKPSIPTVYLLQDAAMLCANAIRKIILSGDVPNWTDLVLGELFNSDSSS